MATVVYREGLNQKSFDLSAKKKGEKIFLQRTYYINGFKQESIFNKHPDFETKKEANEWIKNYSEESYKKDKEFCEDYMK